jgi:hypothetical protein
MSATISTQIFEENLPTVCVTFPRHWREQTAKEAADLGWHINLKMKDAHISELQYLTDMKCCPTKLQYISTTEWSLPVGHNRWRCHSFSTLGLILKGTDELTNMTEKEDGNGRRKSHVCRGSKNGLAARRFMKKRTWQVLGLSWINSLLKVKTYHFSQHETGCYLCSHLHWLIIIFTLLM